MAINSEDTDEDLKPALGKNMETEEIQKQSLHLDFFFLNKLEINGELY